MIHLPETKLSDTNKDTDMTTRMMVSLTRHDGKATGGETAATCQLEIDIDDEVNADAGRLSDRLQQAFAVCRRQVDRELAGRPDGDFENRHDKSLARSGSHPRPATEAQVRAIHAIASKTNTRLASHLDEVYGVSSPQRLTLKQASELIGKLKEQLIH
ncbi:hypothetical protein [Rhodopirellula baltica]|uniref:Uncharacterized protein n=1 Tax=Rhodopirellula baltica SWK14 TaxID=993516 RepID=L7CQI0_RHOBT|nr:hypothetical protein [Rhodopirellula baltica]ELP35902.1 hypothetical protein RBSWK_00164 [Rhodopirellula baltica SWK14]